MNDMTMPAAKAERIRALFHGFLPGSEIGSYVDGVLVAGSGPEQNLTDPATGEVFATFKDAGNDVIDAGHGSGDAGAARVDGHDGIRARPGDERDRPQDP